MTSSAEESFLIIWGGGTISSPFDPTSGTVARDKGKNWPIADRRVSSNNPRNNCGTDFCSSPFLGYKVANFMCHQNVGIYFEKF